MVENGVTIADGVSDKDQVVATAGAFLQVGESRQAGCRAGERVLRQ